MSLWAQFVAWLGLILSGPAQVRLLRAENERYKSENKLLLDRLLQITTGIDSEGKPLFAQTAPPSPANFNPIEQAETRDPYKWLEERERESFEQIRQQEQGESRGFSPVLTSPVTGKISTPGMEDTRSNQD